jgi:hypothetical protein
MEVDLDRKNFCDSIVDPEGKTPDEIKAEFELKSEPKASDDCRSSGGGGEG